MPVPQISFTDVTDQSGVAHASGTYGASWGDVDGDRWSQDSKRIHFGLASAISASLAIKWPSGLVQSFPDVGVDKVYQATEGEAALK